MRCTMFTQPSTEPILGGTAIVNSGFGNRCVICGHHFDECGICNFGHYQGKTYYYPPAEKPSSRNPVVAQEKSEDKVVCQVFSSCRCTICGSYFGDGDDICANGHEIGQAYTKIAS